MQNVSKEIYYEITANFKETFGSSKEREDVPWDEKDEGLDSDPAGYSMNTVDKSPGFTFSFFGEDTVDDVKANTDSYKIETIKASKLSWMEDPRFIDSSSDEMEKEEEGGNGDKMLLPEKAQGEQFPERKLNLFFFFKGDERLQDEDSFGNIAPKKVQGVDTPRHSQRLDSRAAQAVEDPNITGDVQVVDKLLSQFIAIQKDKDERMKQCIKSLQHQFS
ncbi:NOL8 protein, partial [Polypterus senegalus]